MMMEKMLFLDEEKLIKDVKGVKKEEHRDPEFVKAQEKIT